MIIYYMTDFSFCFQRHFWVATRLCDLLIVSVTFDRFVNNGSNRPIILAKERVGILL
jgi:hypothetical protein